jgi:hypothetical protein
MQSWVRPRNAKKLRLKEELEQYAKEQNAKCCNPGYGGELSEEPSPKSSPARGKGSINKRFIKLQA